MTIACFAIFQGIGSQRKLKTGKAQQRNYKTENFPGASDYN